MNKLLRYILPASLTAILGFVIGLLVAGSQKFTPSSPASVRPGTHSLESVSIAAQLTQRDDNDSQIEIFNDIYHQESIFEQLHFAYRFASKSNFEQLAENMESIINDDDPLFSHNIASILLEKMVFLDPLRSLEFIYTHRTIDQNIFISSILTSWIRHDPEAAIDYYKAIANQQLKYIIGVRLLEDPTLIQSGLASEIEEALGRNSELIVEQVRFNRMPASVAFEEAFLRTDHRRRGLMMKAVGRWYQQDPEAVLQRVADLTNRNEKQLLMHVIMSIQSRQDPELALSLLEQYAPNDKNLKRQALINFAGMDPLGALPSVENWVAETGNYDVLSSLISKWVQKDEVAALSYFETIPDEQKPQMISALASSFINASPDRGMEWLLGLGSEYDIYVKTMALITLQQYPEVADRWLPKLESEPSLQAALMAHIAMRRTREDPDSAYLWLDRQRDSPHYESVKTTILHQWVQSEPSRVASIIESDSTDSSRQSLFRQTASIWVSRDSDAAVTWVDSLPDSVNKNQAVQGILSSGQNASDPDRIISLIDSLPEETARNYRLEFASNLIQRNILDIETIIDKINLDPQQIMQLRAAVD